MSERTRPTGFPNPVAGTPLEPLLDRVHIDFVPADPQPSWIRLALATGVALVGSLAADAALVALGKAVFPGTADFVHFQFADYAKLTVIGVVIACAAWPVVTRLSSRPRWVFVRAAVAVTVVLLLPDVVHLGPGPVMAGRPGPGGHAPRHRRGHLQRAGQDRPGGRGSSRTAWEGRR